DGAVDVGEDLEVAADADVVAVAAQAVGNHPRPGAAVGERLDLDVPLDLPVGQQSHRKPPRLCRPRPLGWAHRITASLTTGSGRPPPKGNKPGGPPPNAPVRLSTTSLPGPPRKPTPPPARPAPPSGSTPGRTACAGSAPPGTPAAPPHRRAASPRP